MSTSRLSEHCLTYGNSFVNINAVWDKISKVIFLVVDAYLNWYFLWTVKQRLLNQHGLVKYAPLIKFNARLMVVSVAMDVCLRRRCIRGSG